MIGELDGVPVGTAQLTALALTNFGHFTTMLVTDGRVRGLSRHLDRLVRDCRTVFDAELDPARTQELLRGAVRRAGAAAGSTVVRATVFDPALEVGHPGAPAKPSLLVTLRPALAGPLPPLRVRTAEYRRELPTVKHVGLFEQLRLRRHAQRAGVDDVLFVGPDGLVSEGATWNVGFLDDDRLVWPAADVLPGVTMALLTDAHTGPIAVEPVSPHRIPQLRAAFATNAAIGVRPIAAVNGIELPVDPAVDRLRAEYDRIPGQPL